MVLAALVMFSKPAPAQTATGQKKFEIPIKFEFRLRSELRYNYDLKDAVDDANQPLLQRARLSIAPRYRSFGLFVQLADSPVWNKEKSPYTSADFYIYQLYMEMPLTRGFRARVGRQEIAVGEERLVGAFPWDNKGRSWDAFTIHRESKTWSLKLFAANLPAFRVKDFPRGQNLFGATWKRAVRKGSVEAYAFFLLDQNVRTGESGRSGRTRIWTQGARYTWQNGSWAQKAEAAWQAGERNRDSHLAAAFTYRMDHTWKARLSPSLGGEYSFATGDRNPGDGRSGEFHNLYPTNHSYYGYIDFAGWRNLHNPRIIFAVQPVPKARLEVNYLEILLAAVRGPWKNAGGTVLGRDVTGQSGRRVGGEFDFLATYNLNTHYRLLGGYSRFMPGEFARATRGPDTAHFGYIQLLVSY